MIRNIFTLLLMLSVFTLSAQDLIERTQLGIANPEYRSSPATNSIATTLDAKRQVASSRSSYKIFIGVPLAYNWELGIKKYHITESRTCMP